MENNINNSELIISPTLSDSIHSSQIPPPLVLPPLSSVISSPSVITSIPPSISVTSSEQQSPRTIQDPNPITPSKPSTPRPIKLTSSKSQKPQPSEQFNDDEYIDPEIDIPGFMDNYFRFIRNTLWIANGWIDFFVVITMAAATALISMSAVDGVETETRRNLSIGAASTGAVSIFLKALLIYLRSSLVEAITNLTKGVEDYEKKLKQIKKINLQKQHTRKMKRTNSEPVGSIEPEVHIDIENYPEPRATRGIQLANHLRTSIRNITNKRKNNNDENRGRAVLSSFEEV